MSDLPELVGVKDVAGWLRTSPRAVYIMVQRGQLPEPTVRIGRRILWTHADLNDWIEAKRVVSRPERNRDAD